MNAEVATVLITGGSGKLGRIMVNAALNQGLNVISTFYGNATGGFSVDQSKRLIQIQLDLLNDESIAHFVHQVGELNCDIDVLIHNARSLKSLSVDEKGWSASGDMVDEFKLAVSGPYRLTQSLIGIGKQPKSILFINSIYGKVVPNLNLYDQPGQVPPVQYSIAKSAQLKLAQEWAVRLAGDGVNVNSLVFGGVEGRVDAKFKERYAKLCPQGRMLTDNDIENAFLVAIDSRLKYLTGQQWMFDGGWTLW